MTDSSFNRPKRQRITTPEGLITKAIGKSDANNFAFLAATNPTRVYPSYVDSFVRVLIRKCENDGASAPVRAFTLLALRLKQQQSPLTEGLQAVTLARFARAVLRDKDPSFFLHLVQASIEGFKGTGLRRAHLEKAIDKILSRPTPNQRNSALYQLTTALRGLGPSAVRPDLLEILGTTLASRNLHTFVVSPLDGETYLGGADSLLLLVDNKGPLECLTRGGQPVTVPQILNHITAQKKPESAFLRDVEALAARSGSTAALASAAEIRALVEAKLAQPERDVSRLFRAPKGPAAES